MKNILQSVIEGDYAKFRELVMPTFESMVADKIKQKEDSYREMIRDRKNLKEASEKQREYQAFFKKTLEKYGVKSPKELSSDKAKEFYNEIDKGWKAKKE